MFYVANLKQFFNKKPLLYFLTANRGLNTKFIMQNNTNSGEFTNYASASARIEVTSLSFLGEMLETLGKQTFAV